MIRVQIQREKKFYTDGDRRHVHSTFSPNGLTARIQPDQTIQLLGHFVYVDVDGVEHTSKDLTDRTYKVGDEVNVIVGRNGRITSGLLRKIGLTSVAILPHRARTAKRVSLHVFSALNRR